MQDACVAFLRFYDGEDEREALAWLRVVVRRCAWTIGTRARDRGAPQYVETVERGESTQAEIVVVDERAGTAELVERAEILGRRIEHLGQLKADQRTALILIGLGFSYEEIAAQRGWSLTKVNRCAAEGRMRLRALDRGEGEKT